MKVALSVSQIAKKWDITIRQVQALRKQGRIAGVEKVGNVWVVPENAVKPTRAKEKLQLSFESLFEFILYFESKLAYKWGGGKQVDGIVQMPYLRYDESINKFVRTFYKLDCADTKYNDTLARYGLVMLDDVASIVTTAPYELVIATLTAFIRGERFCDGVFATVAKDRTLLAIVQRLRELKIMGAVI